MRFFAVALLLAAVPVQAQIVSPLQVSAIDATTLATKADVAAVQAAIPSTSGLATVAAVNAVAAQIPQPASAIPPAEAVGGSVGSAGTYRPATAASPRITRAGSCVTAAAGTCTITWATPLSMAPNVILEPINTSATNPVDCNNTALPTTTSVSVKCWSAQTVTVSVLGAVVAPFTTAAAGITVQATAVPPTQ